MKRNGFKFILTSLILMPLYLFAGGQKEETTPLKEINISYVKSPFNLQVMVMKEKELLEKEFAPDKITIKWHEITSGAKQAEAMAAGSLDIASVMNTASVTIANAAGNNVDIIDAVSRPIDTFTIMTGENGPLNVKDLSGKTVAGPKGTVLHQLLESVIQKEGLHDVKLVSMGLPQAQTALLAGKVDAALLAGALVLKTQDAGGQVLTTSEGYVQPLLVSVSPRSFVEAHPGVITRYKKIQSQAYDFIINSQDESLAIGAAQQDLSPDYALDLYKRSGIANNFVKADEEGLLKDILFLQDLGMIEGAVTPHDLISELLDVQ
ncbi:ABC transporter substrate-binding protein [Oceanispirochaeta sp. M1]|uniref:ABC transporter substrate-binding protein n=1 Tax=Oceanispirochaeta sp. M1 TaxID=2283433 RepID=UPI000E091CA8|nr:NrtA/SsuA/CpmA family ABC transporter substrate-binding protein [Oceanispirochaeta sp. M1]NPD75308.1 ABC transporter substrate-binding protein [Oceanispirochaeta sp. M1]RDG28832.1 aliphatic sulfonate ABC transporter [Oceanispirochaeta sp. M1]